MAKDFSYLKKFMASSQGRSTLASMLQSPIKQRRYNFIHDAVIIEPLIKPINFRKYLDDHKVKRI